MSTGCGGAVHSGGEIWSSAPQAAQPDAVRSVPDVAPSRGNALTDSTDPTGSPPVDRQRLLELVLYEYRSLVVRRLGVTAEWGVLEWTDEAACADSLAATPSHCGRCPVVAECLAAALASDDPAQWRGGTDRGDREHLWAGLERTYREVRDFELLRFDVSRLGGSPSVHRPPQAPRRHPRTTPEEG